MGCTSSTTDILWHYTSIDTALKILETNQLRATHSSFLNDTTEVITGAKHLLSYMETKYSNQNELLDIKELLKGYSSEHIKYFFILCFSANGDSLSQWRSYTPNGGCAIGFDKMKLNDKISNVKGVKKLCNSFFKCFYTDLIKTDTRTEIEAEFDEICQKEIQYKQSKSSKPLTTLNIACLLAAMKDKSFEVEDEYRFNLMRDQDYPVEFFNMRPYINVKIENIWECIKTIRISPNYPNKFGKQALEFINAKICEQLKKDKLEELFTIEESKIPYYYTGQ